MTRINSSSHLISKLQSILRRQRLVLFTGGILTTIAVVLATSIVLSLLANVVVLPVGVKIALLAAAGATTLYFFFRHAVARLFGGDVDQVAIRLEEKHPELKGQLIAAVQFARQKPHSSFSQELLEMTEQNALKRASGVNFNEVVSYHSILRHGKLFLVALVLGAGMLILFPGLFSYSYEVYSNATTEVAPPIAYDVVPTPGSTDWVKYRDIEIGAAIFGQRLPEKATIHHKLVDGHWQKTEVDLKKVDREVLPGGDSLNVALTLRQINKSFDYYVEAGRVKTEVQQVNVVDRPRVTGIELSIFYPDYTELSPMVIDENNGSFSAVVGSRANIKVAANLPIESAALVFDDSSRTPLTVEGKTATTSLRVDKSRSYSIELRDHLGERNPDPIEYYVTAVPDEYPSVNVIHPGFDVNLTDEMLLPLKVRIFDDYGFSSLVMKYTIVSQGRQGDENVAVLHYSDNIKTEGEIEFNWDMDKLNLYPGDYAIYHFEVADNDVISGPKVSQSRKYIARLPSLDEIIAETEKGNRQRISQTEGLIKQGKELVERLKSAARKMQAQQNNHTPNTDWQQKKELESISQKNAEMLQQVEKMAEDMEKAVDRMQENALMSREIMEKLRQIQELYEEVATPEMREAQRKLMEALESMDPQQLQEAMKDFEMSQEELMQRLERTAELLKKMQVEQKMEAMVRQAEQLAEQQEQMNKRTDEASDESLSQMSQEEEQLKEQFDNLQQQVDDLRQMMQEAKMEQSQEAQKFAEAVEQNTAGENMQQMAEQMQQQQKQGARKEGEQAHSKLMEMLGEMQKQQMAMQGGDAEKMQKAMRRAIDDANYLSKSQEELQKQAATMDPASLMLRDIANQQQDLRSACNGLKQTVNELGKQSPFIAAELQKTLNNAINNMELATQGLSDKKGTQGMRHQRDAMVNLNEAAVRLMESLESQQQCNNASSCSNPMQALEQMTKKQQQINEQTGQCNNPGAQGQNPKQGQGGARQQLQRLAGEQGALRKSMEQLAQEFGNSRQILGRLDNIADEMKDIEESLEAGDAGEQTQERQLRVLSRMLEASRSLQRKDYSDQRKATTAEQQPVYIPEALSNDILNDRTQLENRLQEFLGEGYPPQYEEQIKAYFRALMAEQARMQQQQSAGETGQ